MTKLAPATGPGKVWFLGKGLPKPPPRYAELKRKAQVTESYIRRVIAKEELFDLEVHATDEAEAQRFSPWLQAIFQAIGLPWNSDVLKVLTFMQFRDVGLHSDSRLMPFGDSTDESEEHFYVNLQLVGSGELQMKDPDTGLFTAYAVEPGDLYAFDQRTDHKWSNSKRSQLSKAISFMAPVRALERLPQNCR